MCVIFAGCVRQVEFRYLTEVTGDPKYAQKVNHVYDLMSKLNPKDGLFPIFISHSNGRPVGNQARPMLLVILRGLGILPFFQVGGGIGF